MSAPRLFVTRPLPADPAAMAPGIEVSVFPEDRPPTRQELLTGAHDADGLVTLLSDRIDGELLDACAGVRVVANVAVGHDNVDLAAAAERGVWVTNTPDVLTEATADLTWALILAVARRLREGERLVREGRFRHWSPVMLLGVELSGATLGVFGMGRIGRAVARRARGFGMEVVYDSRSELVAAAAAELGARRVGRDELLREADVLTIHCPLNEGTRHAIGAPELSAMKPTAILINTARGPIVHEDALASALERGDIAGAGLDVYEDEPRVNERLLARDDVVLLPHIGSATRTTRRRMAEIAVQNAVAVLQGDEPPNPVNRPVPRRPS